MTEKRMLELILAGENVEYHAGREVADQLIAEDRMQYCYDEHGLLLPFFRKKLGDDFARGMDDRARERMKISFV